MLIRMIYVRADHFWNKSIHCEQHCHLLPKLSLITLCFMSDASFSAIANLIILGLFVYQMENTRTPSGLAKVSFWSVALMVGADSWLFSAVCTVLDGTYTEMAANGLGTACRGGYHVGQWNYASITYPIFHLPMHRSRLWSGKPARSFTFYLADVPSCSVSAFCYIESKHQRQQILQLDLHLHPCPHLLVHRLLPRPRPPGPHSLVCLPSFRTRLVIRIPEVSITLPVQRYEWLLILHIATVIFPLVIMLMMILLGIIPQIVPVFLVIMYSFWIPQIWRNARRGVRKAVSWRFVMGMSGARLALPLCESWLRITINDMLTRRSVQTRSLAPITYSSPTIPVGGGKPYPSASMLTEGVILEWIWALVAYVWVQVGVLVIQERFTPSFL